MALIAPRKQVIIHIVHIYLNSLCPFSSAFPPPPSPPPISLHFLFPNTKILPFYYHYYSHIEAGLKPLLHITHIIIIYFSNTDAGLKPIKHKPTTNIKFNIIYYYSNDAGLQPSRNHPPPLLPISFLYLTVLISCLFSFSISSCFWV